MVDYGKIKRINDKFDEEVKAGLKVVPVGVNPTTLNKIDRIKYLLLGDMFIAYKFSHLTVPQFAEEIGENRTTINLMLKLDYERFTLDKILEVYLKVLGSKHGKHMDKNTLKGLDLLWK